MTNHKNTINRIANTIVLFFALFGISAKAVAQDYNDFCTITLCVITMVSVLFEELLFVCIAF